MLYRGLRAQSLGKAELNCRPVSRTPQVNRVPDVQGYSPLDQLDVAFDVIRRGGA